MTFLQQGGNDAKEWFEELVAAMERDLGWSRVHSIISKANTTGLIKVRPIILVGISLTNKVTWGQNFL